MAKTEATKNDVNNVSDGTGLAGGYFYRAQLGSTKPTDLTTPLDAAFKVLGFISEDGFTFSTETDREDIKDMNGETVHSAKSSHSETFTVTLAEVKKGTMAVQYGEKNVDDTAGKLTVHVKGDDPERAIYVAECVLKNGRRWRRLIHDAQPTELGDLAVKAGELFGRETTFTAYKDATAGDYYTDWFESTETGE